MQCDAMKTSGTTSGGCYNRGCNKLRPQLSLSPSHHANRPTCNHPFVTTV